jgi:glycosyltransferase 2 family protein
VTKTLLQFAKSLWMVALLVIVAWYIRKNFDSIGDELRATSPERFLLASIALVLSRLLLVVQSVRSVRVVDVRIPYRRMFTINSLSQLAKYLPGGIWHFVGRARFYHLDGLPLKMTFQAMVIENVWLILGAGMTGLILSLAVYGSGPGLILAITGLLGVWLAGLFLVQRWFGRTQSWPAYFTTLSLLLTIWLLTGWSFWVLLPDAHTGHDIILVVGAFGISWTIGFLTVFAPGGIGVREAVLVALLAGVVSPTDAAIFASTHRLMWILTEVTLGITARVFFASQVTIPEQEPPLPALPDTTHQ